MRCPSSSSRPPQLLQPVLLKNLQPLFSHIEDSMSSSFSQPLFERPVWANIHPKALFYLHIFFTIMAPMFD